MDDVIAKIQQVNAAEIEAVLNAVRERYSELFPEWEVVTVSIRKNADKGKQLEEIISMLEKMKTSP